MAPIAPHLNPVAPMAPMAPPLLYPMGACSGGFPCFTKWAIDANGLHRILSLDNSRKTMKYGKLEFIGSLFGNPINGTWDEYSKQIVFTEPNMITGAINHTKTTTSPVAAYTGYLTHVLDNSTISSGSFVAPGTQTRCRMGCY